MMFPLPHHVIPRSTLVVGRDATSFRVSGASNVDLRALGPLRRVFQRLVELHLTTPGRALSVDAIFEAGWPGEGRRETTLEARRGRAYTAISKLRRRGLGAVLVRVGTGYRIDPRTCVIAEAPPANETGAVRRAS
ncbi:MAG: hypothetical protein JST00_35645 [Deltaproteobacteria bacterium]|nr:hypothetical protein [Deltaproteobacteria bacterium]